MSRRALPLACCLVLLAVVRGSAAYAAEPPAAAVVDAAESRHLDRLVALCQTWNTAKYLHPKLWSSDVDWDAAFVAAATAVDASSSTADYRAAAERMLGVLGDSATRVEEKKPEPTSAPAAPAPASSAPAAGAKVELVRSVEDGVVFVDLPGYQRANGPYSLRPLGEKLAAAAPASHGVVVDLRFAEDETSYWAGAALTRAAGELVPRAVQAPAERWIVRWGYEPQRGSSSGGYRSGLVTGAAEAFAPAGAGRTWRVVFLVNEGSPLVPVVAALLASGDARLVSEGELDPAAAESAVPVALGEGLVALVRTVEEIGAPRWDDVVVRAGDGGGDGDAALATALDLLRRPWEPPSTTAATGAAAVRRLENRYAEPALPPLGLRLLAGCRAWGVIHHFYPYLELIDDWDAAFRASLPALAAAADEEAYARAVLTLMAHVADGHTGVWGAPAVQRVLGAASPNVEVRIVEGAPTVTAADPAIAGLVAGDVVVSVDGEPAGDRIERLLPVTTGSTPLAHQVNALWSALAGAEGSTARLEVKGADGKLRQVEAPRTAQGWRPPPPTGPAWKRLRPRIGYADLVRLERQEVDPMLEELRDTDALVLDLRGYPKGTAWPLAARLNVTGAKTAALFRRREVSALTPEESESGFFFAQPLPETRSWTYRGKVVMLLDERAISQSEHTALFLEQAANATFIGSPTAGANGDVTNFPLPGGLSVSFTGHDVRHADGRQLQRVGIVPHVPVTPTLRGIREGRDEVLERALAWLDETLAGASR